MLTALLNTTLGLSTILDVEIEVPATGARASFCRVHETRSEDYRFSDHKKRKSYT